MKIALIISISFLLISNFCFGQKQGNIWFFGEGAGMDFNGGSPVPITGGQVYSNPQEMGEFIHSEGSAVISDSTGSLLFYSNGENIWNSNHQVMPNGDSLKGMYSSTHSCFIVPQPLSDSIFYVFTTDGLERDLEDGLRYSVVNMCLDNGLGDVIPEQKNILLLDTVSEKLAGINHQNGKDIWLIAHKYNSDAFYAYQISENGIVDTVITNIGSLHGGNEFWNAIGQMKASPDGNKIALVYSNINPAVAELFDFDKATGILSNHISLNTDNNEYGVEFSPDNSKLYITNSNGLHQFNLLAGGGTQAAINSSKTNIPMSYNCYPAGLQLGPDNKIYVSRCSTFVAAINNPNAQGTFCDFVDNAINLGTTNAKVSFPSFIQGFEYHNKISNCKITSVNDLGSLLSYELYPNPASQSITLKLDNLKQKVYYLLIYDFQGQVVKEVSNINIDKQIIDLSNLTTGLYFFQLSSNRETLFSKKIIIE